MDERLAIIKDVVFHPTKALRTIGNNGKFYYRVSIVLLIVTSVIGGIFDYFVSDVGETLGGIELGAIIFFVLPIQIALFYVVVLIVSAAGKIFKGKSDFKGLFSSLTYASIPFWIFSIPLSMFFVDFTGDINNNIIPSLVSISILFIWGLILFIIAIRESNNFGTVKAICTFLVSIVILLILIFTVVGFVMYLGAELVPEFREFI